MKTKLFTAILLLCFYFGVGQNLQISGTVNDDLNTPLPGVSVVVKGTTKGTTTDFDGLFSMEDVESGSVLVFSYVGFKTQEVTISSANPITITMQEDLQALDEVVVIGYGTQKKKEVTGAVAVVDSEAIEKLNPTRVEQALQGQVSGVNVTTGSGSPGSGSNIRIRGVSTNGDNRPLILVDGNVIEDLAVINPNDIKSINVLKDATAGIYGVRAANGVILITTKTGRKETPISFQFDAYTGVQVTSNKIDLLNPRDFAIYVNDAGDRTRFFVYPDEGTDWQDEVFNQATISNINFSASGGTKKSAYTFGVSYLDQDGIVGLGKSNFRRITARLGYQYDLLENLKLSLTGLYTNSKKNNLPEGGIGSVLYSAVNVNPDLPLRDENGAFSLVNDIRQVEIINPLAQIANTYNTTRVDKYSATFGLDYSFWEHFKVSSKFQMNHAIVLDDVFRPEVFYGNSKSANVDAGNNEVVDYGAIFDDYTWDNYITYTNSFNDVHNLTVLLGTSAFRTWGEFYGEAGLRLKNGSNSIDDASIENVEGQITPRFNESALANGADVFDNRLFSIFSRLQYNYKGKYLLSGVIRRDGSSNFGPENKYGYFPSGSIGWNISEEDFLLDHPWINSLKLRASYGVIGNDRIGSFGFIDRLSGEGVYSSNLETTQDDLLFGVAVGPVSNPEIRWEKQKTGNIGFDAGLFNNKITISADAFSRQTEDLLVTPQVSGLLGASAPGSAGPTINAGTVENRGFEFKIGYDNSFSENFSLNFSYNVSFLENEVLFVESDNGFLLGGEYGVGLGIQTSRMEAGHPIGYFYGYKTDGIYQTYEEIDALNAAAPDGVYHSGATPGDLKFVDTNGNGFIDAEDRTNIGDPIPEVTMGFNLGFNYKNFDFSSSAFASLGNDMVRDYERKDLYANRGDYLLDRWQGTGTSNTVPRAASGQSINTDNFNDFHVEDASFLRLQNVQLGYTISPDALEGTGIDKLRFYISGNNLLTITDYKGYDPAASSGAPIGAGVDKGFYPVAKSYLLGLNLNF